MDKREIVRDLTEVGPVELLLHANRLEEKSFAFHVHIQERQFPVTGCDLGLLDFELASRVQMAQQTAREFDLVSEMSCDLHEPGLFAVDPDVPFHGLKDLSLVSGRPEVRIWCEVQFDRIASGNILSNLRL